jgi:predicted NUDIX family NTP pyrophosphohydrolase
MRKFLCALFALACLAAGALAEEGAFRAGTGAAKLGDSLFFSVGEGETVALVRVAAGKPMLAARAEDLGPVLTHGGSLYYLEKKDGAWTLVRRGEATMPETVYAFAAGAEVGRLCECGEDLFVLVDGQLHVVYPSQKLCLRLASAKMREYAVDGEYAYFISDADVVSYELPTGSGIAAADAGCLYRLNLSTGNTSLIMKAGVEDLSYRAGKLYFHNLSDAYLSGEGAVAGKLYSFDLSTETLAQAQSDYDWAYFVTDAGLIVYRADGVLLTGADGQETSVCAPGPRAEVWYSDGTILVYDPDAASFAAYPVPAE